MSCIFCLKSLLEGIPENFTRWKGFVVCAECVYCLGDELEETRQRIKELRFGGRDRDTWVVLKLSPQNSDVFVVVPNRQYIRTKIELEKPEFIDSDASKFYFEEHSCPTNWLNVCAIMVNGDQDPHGLFQFVKEIYADDVAEPVDAFNET
jgi:hypothetical protein